jgi:hypothetical protein
MGSLTGNGACPSRPTDGSGRRLREQSCAEFPHRLTAPAGSLKAGTSVFLPIKVFNRVILCGFVGIVKEKTENFLTLSKLPVSGKAAAQQKRADHRLPVLYF